MAPLGPLFMSVWRRLRPLCFDFTIQKHSGWGALHRNFRHFAITILTEARTRVRRSNLQLGS